MELLCFTNSLNSLQMSHSEMVVIKFVHKRMVSMLLFTQQRKTKAVRVTARNKTTREDTEM